MEQLNGKTLLIRMLRKDANLLWALLINLSVLHKRGSFLIS